MCNFHVGADAVRGRFGVELAKYFEPELLTLSGSTGPVADGFLTIGRNGLDVTERGRLFVRNICMTFDRYLPGHLHGRPVFSRTV